MISLRIRRASALATVTLAAVALPAGPASALPGLDISAGLYGAYDLGGKGFGADLDAYLGTPILKVSGHYLTLAGSNLAEAVLRFEPLPVPFISVRPGVGYQGNSFFKAGAFDHAPLGSLAVGVAIPLVPVSADAEVNASYPLSLGQPVFGYSANVNVFPIPLLPVAISARYRGYALGTAFSPALSAVEGGLRVAL
jgi:hypothetical protein